MFFIFLIGGQGKATCVICIASELTYLNPPKQNKTTSSPKPQKQQHHQVQIEVFSSVLIHDYNLYIGVDLLQRYI